MTKKAKTGVIILIALFILILMAGTVTIVVSTKSSSEKTLGKITNAKLSDNTDIFTSNIFSGRDFIGALHIEGVIEDANNQYNQKWLLNTINELKNNSHNVALAIYIDSPGGGVYQADEVYLALQDYKTTGRPIFVYQGPMTASGGYYISCAADQIYANRNTLTGCIGVIFGQSIDITGLLDKAGIKSKTFHSGRNKTMLNPDEPLTEEQSEIMQSMCDECYEQFVSIVANARDMSYEDAAALSDGRLYTAKQGLENGLVDRIDSWDNMITILAEDVLEKPGIKVIEYKYESENDLLNLLLTSISKIQKQETASKIGLPVSAIDYLEFDSYPAYLYR